MRLKCLAAACLVLASATGCYAPMCSPGVPARTLSDEYRWPIRTAGEPLNYSMLAASPPSAYLLGSGDVLEVTVPDLVQRGDAQPFEVQVLESGEAYFPRVGPIQLGGLTLAQAQYEINSVLSDGYLQNPGASIKLLQKGTINVMVLGAVNTPGTHALPRHENDVAHALAAAGGFSEEAGDVIEIHRQSAAGMEPVPAVISEPTPSPWGRYDSPGPSLENYPAMPGYGMPSPATVAPQPEFVPPADAFSPPAWPSPSINPVPTVTPQSFSQPMQVERYSSQPAPQGAVVPATQLPPMQPAGMNPLDSYRGGHSQQPVNGMPVIRGQSPQHYGDLPGWPMPGINSGPIIRISLRGQSYPINPNDVVLHAGDVVVVPRKTDEVFFVVGPLSEQSRIRFSVGDRDREIGNGLLLPPDREIDVVTAVAMAGYIDPIDSPTTVTVHRCGPDGMPLLIKVDLIAARSDPRETILVHPGDIIYLNPDHWWYWRRTVDRVIDQALGTAIGRWLTN